MRQSTRATILAIGILATGSARAAAPLADYGKLPAVEQMQLSPSGDQIAYIAVVGDDRRVMVKKTGGADLFTVNVGELKLRRLEWMDSSHVLVETSKTLDNDPRAAVALKVETVQSTILDTTTGKMSNVFGAELKMFHATYGYYGHATVNGRSFGYFGGLSLTTGGESFSDFSKNNAYMTHDHTDLYKVDLQTGHPELVSGGSELLTTHWVVGADGALAGHDERDRKGEWRLYADPRDQNRLAAELDPTGDFNLIGLGRTVGTVLVYEPYGVGKDFKVVEYSARGAAPTAPFGDVGVRALVSDPASGRLIGGVTNSEPPRTMIFDPAGQAKFDKVAHVFPGERVTLESATTSLDQMIVLTSGPGDSGTYFYVDMAARKVAAVGWQYPTILQSDVGAVQAIDYKAADGLAMNGILTLPPGREPKDLPLVVLPHGGPEARDYPDFDWWAQAFASRGYAVFQPNFRGSSGFGKAFRDAGHGQWGRKMQTDVSDGVAELARRGLVDSKRACVVGGSYGGYVALAGVTVQQSLYRCAVSVGGIGDLNGMLNWEAERFGFDSITLRYHHQFLGVTSNGDAALHDLSPRRFADRADAPILLIFGKDDTVVSIDQSRDMAAALRGAGKPVEVLQLANEDHWLSKASTRTQMLEASMAFVEKYNPPNGAK